jgi:fatty-acyl-CoA synthase
MKSYLKDPRAFAGGWFHAGGLAVVDPDGYIKLKDRQKDIIISGGENISPLKVEDALLPGGRQCGSLRLNSRCRRGA